MTEDEAKTKWCPFARMTMSNQPMQGNHSANRFPKDSIGYQNVRCIGSECMAWRKELTGNYEFDAVDDETLKVINAPEVRGYCGLAGKL